MWITVGPEEIYLYKASDTSIQGRGFFLSKGSEIRDHLLQSRTNLGGPYLERLRNIIAPVYFHVKPIKTVLATNKQCDFAFSYDTGHLELKNAVSNAFPQPRNSPIIY
ncbi:hypothetical protein M758_4G214200 [Ceratodon purpureus]|nr:hypothetical protein M758_4G214200 [Ceratodon purpureus]